MPIDRNHAFAVGPTYPLPQSRRGRLGVIMGRVLARVLVYADRIKAEHVAGAFYNSAMIGSGCRFGLNAWCVNRGRRENIQIGNDVICRGILRCEDWRPCQLSIANDVYIGDDCIISCADRVEIGSYTLLAHGVQIFDNDSHPVSPTERELDYKTAIGSRTGARPYIAGAPILIGERAWIGFNSTILKGVRIGDGCIVAANSVVTSDIPPYSVAAGNPAKVIRYIPAEHDEKD